MDLESFSDDNHCDCYLVNIYDVVYGTGLGCGFELFNINGGGIGYGAGYGNVCGHGYGDGCGGNVIGGGVSGMEVWRGV